MIAEPASTAFGAGKATVSGDPEEWVFVPLGTLQQDRLEELKMRN